MSAQSSEGQRQVILDNAKLEQGEPTVQTLSLEKPVPAALQILCEGQVWIGPLASFETRLPKSVRGARADGFSTDDLIPVSIVCQGESNNATANPQLKQG